MPSSHVFLGMIYGRGLPAGYALRMLFPLMAGFARIRSLRERLVEMSRRGSWPRHLMGARFARALAPICSLICRSARCGG